MNKKKADVRAHSKLSHAYYLLVVGYCLYTLQ